VGIGMLTSVRCVTHVVKSEGP